MRVVSVSLGTSKRDKIHKTTILGQEFQIERAGTDGDKAEFIKRVEELDGKVDAIGIGGADLYVATSKKRYEFKEIKRMVEGVKQTPVVDGSGLKHTLERETILTLARDGTVDFQQERVLCVSAVDRYGMAQSLAEVCPNVVFGDLLFGLGLPIPIRKYKTVELIASILLPIITRLPQSLFYPTGKKQEERSPKHPKVFADSTFVCGDWHYIRRYMPNDMSGKTVLTQTLREADLQLLKEAGARRAITTTPDMGGETYATNVMEGVIVSLIGRAPAQCSPDDYLDVLKKLDWKPNVFELQS